MSPSIPSILSSHRPDLKSYEDLYKHFHAHPCLSYSEGPTASTISSFLSSLPSSPFTIVPSIGGHGLAAYFSNGPGPTVLLRADMDALPVEEATGLEYASKVKATDQDGTVKSVMHACGHDVHITSLLAAAEGLVRGRENWSGTLLLVFQPAEERATGAQDMVDDGLYEKVPRPDVAIGGHVTPHRAGVIGTRRGVTLSSADSFHLTIPGRQAHGSAPHASIDPIVLAASTIMRLQTIVSRETNPADFAVLTVGAVHAGDRENIIPSSAELKINTRAQDPDTRNRILNGMRRVIKAEAEASGAAPPTLTPTTSFPLLVNDDAVTEAIEKTFSQIFEPGTKGYIKDMPRMSFSEDFGILATSIGIPSLFFLYGGTEPSYYDAMEKEGKIGEIPGNHSPGFKLDVGRTLRVGVDAYMGGALTFLTKGMKNEARERL